MDRPGTPSPGVEPVLQAGRSAMMPPRLRKSNSFRGTIRCLNLSDAVAPPDAVSCTRRLVPRKVKPAWKHSQGHPRQRLCFPLSMWLPLNACTI